MIVVIMILIGIMIDVTMRIVTKNKNSLTETQRPSDPMIVTLPTTLPNSEDLILDSIPNRNNSIVECPFKHPFIVYYYSIDNGWIVDCQQLADFFSCASTDCDRVSVVHPCGTYSSDCYVIGQVITEDSSSNKWYRINLRVGGYGYVNGEYCFNNFSRCY